MLQEFYFEVTDIKYCENQVVDHLSLLEPNVVVYGEKDIDEPFPYECVMVSEIMLLLDMRIMQVTLFVVSFSRA